MKIAGWLVSQLVRLYQVVLSPLLPNRCRFYPSCSAYAVEALQEHGVIRGGALSVWRVLRCNPWSHGGVDHVPACGDAATISRTTQKVCS